MNPFSVCLLVLLSADPQSAQTPAVYEFSPKLAAAIRGQSPTPIYDPFNSGAGSVAPGSPMMGPTLEAPITSDPYQSFGMPAQDPYMYGGDPAFAPGMYGQPSGPVFSGVNGPQPYRFGYIPKLEIGYIPQSPVKDFNSDVEMFELDSELRHNSPFTPGWVFSSAPQFDYRAWNFGGPLANTYRINLYRFGWDLELFKVKSNGWTLDFAFNPSINSDMESNLTSNAWNFDTRIAATYQVDPSLMVVLGVQYWDRVDDIIIPHAGVVYTPNDVWEFRLLFPKARISRFVGHFWGGHHWLYVSSEYNVESYQIDLTAQGAGPSNQVQYEDWRLALGLRSDHVSFDKFIEVAWDLNRDFEFQDTIPKFEAGNQVLIRGGIRF